MKLSILKWTFVKNFSCFRFYHELESAGVLRPMSASIGGMNDLAPGTRHFVAPTGISSVAKYFIEQSGMNYIISCERNDSLMRKKYDLE